MKPIVLKVLTLVFLLTLSGFAFAQTKQVAHPMEGAEERENYDVLWPSPPVTGPFLAGVVYDGKSGILPELSAIIPPDWAGELACVSVLSLDGRYEAERTYTLPKPGNSGKSQSTVQASNNVTPFLFQTKHTRYMNENGREHFGITLVSGSCDNPSKLKSVVPVFWSSHNMSTPRSLSVMINTRRAEEAVLYVVSANKQVEIECTQISEETVISFDYKCVIGSEHLKLGSNRVEIYTRRYGSPADYESFDILIAQ